MCSRMGRQICRKNPFLGDFLPSRVALLRFGTNRPALPFPHPWNYQRPLDILETYFCEAGEAEPGGAQHNRYIELFGCAPVLVSRDPGVIRAVLHDTGDKPGAFDRDTLPSQGIARATGEDTLLYANGPLWRKQKKLAAKPFSRTNLFQPERFQDFEQTFRQTVVNRIDVLRAKLIEREMDSLQLALEPEIKVVMLEMLANNFFGAEISYERLRDHYAPSLERVIDHIVSDTVINKLGIPVTRRPGNARLKADYAAFEELTDLAIAPRAAKRGLWKQFESDVSNEGLRSNIRVFLAGALEATTSFATWALHHLAHHPEIQQQVFEEVKDIDTYLPEHLKHATQLNAVLEETLRLTPSLYFLPRRSSVDTWIETPDKRKLMIPAGTHILLDVWHANRREDYWGVEVSGYPAADFAPARWQNLSREEGAAKKFLHFGFGNGPRVCPGKFLGQLEVALVVGAMVKTFSFTAADPYLKPRAGVSTKPRDGVLVDLSLRS